MIYHSHHVQSVPSCHGTALVQSPVSHILYSRRPQAEHSPPPLAVTCSSAGLQHTQPLSSPPCFTSSFPLQPQITNTCSRGKFRSVLAQAGQAQHGSTAPQAQSVQPTGDSGNTAGPQAKKRKEWRGRSRSADQRNGKLTLPRQHPQPRIWAAAARNAPLPGAIPVGNPPPAALGLLQSLERFSSRPMRVSPPLSFKQYQLNISVEDVIRSVQEERRVAAALRRPTSAGLSAPMNPQQQQQQQQQQSRAASGADPASETPQQQQQQQQNRASEGLSGAHLESRNVETTSSSDSSSSISKSSRSISGSHLGLQGSREAQRPASLSLEEVVSKAHVIVLNHTLSALNSASLLPTLETLLKAILASERQNSHTWASAFGAYSDAGRPDLAIVLFQQACRTGTDIGPMGASALMKLCASQDNLDMGLELFYKMTSMRTTFNRYVYNCLLHLCGKHGRVYDGLDLLAAMRADGGVLEDCTPDGYTYSALLKAITISKKVELLPMVYNQMMRDRVEPGAEVWAQLVSLAGRANRADLAAAYFNAALSNGCPPSSHIYNAMLAAMARGGMSLDQMLVIYHDMMSLSLPPDGYTYVPLFSAMARAGSSLAEVDALAHEMKTTMGVQLNTQLGTALLNAYKHVPTMGSPGVTDALISRVERILSQLVAQRHANTQTFALVAAVHAQAGNMASVQRVLVEAVRARAPPDVRALRSLSVACEDGGLSAAAAHFMEQALLMKKQQPS